MSEQRTNGDATGHAVQFILAHKDQPNAETLITQALQSYGTIREVEAIKQQEEIIISLLSLLPIAITITPQEDTYVWQCLDGIGTNTIFAGAVSNALHFLIAKLGGMSQDGSRQEFPPGQEPTA